MLRLHNTLRLSLQTGSGRSLSSLAFTEIIALKGTPASLKQRLPLTKIVATIGPASENLPTLSHVVDAGMRLMRINFSHATYEEADLRMANLNKCFGINSLSAVTSSAETKFSNMRAVMLDTQGPEIRTGSFAGGVKEVELVIGDTIELTTEENVRTAQSASRLWISYGKLLETVEAGSRVLLDDGAVEVMVQSKDLGNNTVTCQVMNSGTLGNKKGVNMPGLVVQLPAMSLKDKEDIKWGITNDVDFIAASFVRKASDVSEIRAYCAELMALLPQAKRGPIPLIISKIESVEALVNFDSILEESDAIMVARGDLAVEIPMETIANVQKEIVKRCNKAGKPVIVATQMLETMQKNPRPTRAECTDVANAVYDGADCVMLSGESAKGKYPVETVGLMKRITDQAELGLHETAASMPRGVPDLHDPVQAMAYAVAQAAAGQRFNTRFACIAVMMSSDNKHNSALAKAISKFRPHCPVICMVPSTKEGRLLQIYSGLHPVLMVKGEREPTQALLHMKKIGMVSSNDQVLLVRQRSANLDIQIELCTA